MAAIIPTTVAMSMALLLSVWDHCSGGRSCEKLLEVQHLPLIGGNAQRLDQRYHDEVVPATEGRFDPFFHVAAKAVEQSLLCLGLIQGLDQRITAGNLNPQAFRCLLNRPSSAFDPQTRAPAVGRESAQQAERGAVIELDPAVKATTTLVRAPGGIEACAPRPVVVGPREWR